MRIHRELPSAECGAHLPVARAVSIGTFDGVHRGHHALIQLLRQEAARRHLETAVFTFTDMPHCYFRPDECPHLLTLADEKAMAFAELKIDDLWMVPFDSNIAGQTAVTFVTRLVHGMGMRLLVAGPDFVLGKGREGDIPKLRSLGAELGFEVLALDDKLALDGEPVSSTRVRNCVEAGQVRQAAHLLGHPFHFSGNVVKGRQLGRTLGVPTINLQVHDRKVLPAYGIYAAWAHFDNDATPHPAALSIGSNPTVDGSHLNIEFHVIGEEVPTPPHQAELVMVERLRDEVKFPSLAALVEQMQADIARADTILRAELLP
jgi:riboflavin kinase/FMN adenylyltransferase